MTLVHPALHVALASLARLYPWTVDPSVELGRALGYCRSDATADTIVRAGYGAALVGAVGGFVLVAALSGSVGVALCVALAVALATAHAAHRLPVVVANARRTRALGATTGLVGRAVLRMRLDPTTERAARFAARTGDGPLAESLGEHVRRATGTPASGFDGFVREWNAWFPALDRAVALLVASATASGDERGRSLDRALSAVLDGTRSQLSTFTAEMRGPATALYAFGVLLPLALVGVLPAARVAGVPVSLPVFVALYDVLLPLSVLVACGWLLARRPVAFPPPRVGRDHPDVPSTPWRELAAGVFASGVGWVVGSALVPWAGPIAVVGFGSGATLAVRYRPVKAVRDRVREVESGLPDALYLVGRRVSGGVAVETALVRASDETTGATGELLADVVRIQRTLRVDVHAAFFGRYGVLTDLPSDRLHGTAGLLALAATQGTPAGSAIVAMADQLDSLRDVEEEARRELATITGTLTNTAAVFAPLVGGATVTLADRMAHAGPGAESVAQQTASTGASASATTFAASGGGALSSSALGTAVGVYVLLLAALLTALAVGLEHGADRPLVGYRVGLALLTATTTYLTAVVAAGLLV
ncbi:hypothetical protein SAMN04487950_2013 [Halogranum rubrum]|uniref:Flp pilus assembly protein TadB n=1 Tax=Halogranum rubrum TaxID=553466 RepID=A0A1I4E9K4_9EURY|nr:type II secretion system protein [Halogranum rubrum]SFL02435.1 hypothetical protein SAMN04487950_2013 [Halogranum rubrum]